MTTALRLMPQGLQLGYYFGRWVDDVVDGDEAVPNGFTAVDSWLDHLEEPDSQPVCDSPAFFLLQEAIDHLEPLENKSLGDNVRQEFAGFFI